MSWVCTRMHSALQFGVSVLAWLTVDLHGRAVRIVHLISIDAAVVNLVANGIERPGIDTIAREVTERFRMIEDFS